MADTEFADRAMRLAAGVKGNGQPRMAHQAAYQLKLYLDRSGRGGGPMFMAPYIPNRRKLSSWAPV